MEEIWKDVQNYPGYQVSNLGRVRSFLKQSNRKTDLLNGRILDGIIHRKNIVVNLKTGTSSKTLNLKHLVASHFMDGYSPTDNLICLDGNIRNNRIDNISLPKVADLEGEIWKTIDGFDNKFQISNLGRVKNDGVLATLAIGGKGYLRFGVSKNNKCKHYSVHRYVLITFIGKPQGDRIYANHKSGIKTDNRLENLEWCTATENMKHSYDTGLHPRRYGKNAPQIKAVDQYTKDGVFVKSFYTLTEAAKSAGVGTSNISACARNAIKTSGGFVWKFKKI